MVNGSFGPAGNELTAYYLPLLGWTSFASSVADYQALKNADPVFKTKPLLEYMPVASGNGQFKSGWG